MRSQVRIRAVIRAFREWGVLRGAPIVLENPGQRYAAFPLLTGRGFLELARCDKAIGETVNIGWNSEIRCST
jgi:hypothetical protein